MTESTENRVQHTPGPWHVQRGSRQWNVVDRDDQIVAMVSAFDTGADSRLIAEAPELLAVLRGVLEHAGSHIDTEWLERAATVLAAVRGVR